MEKTKKPSAFGRFWNWTEGHKKGYIISVIFAIISVVGGIVPFYGASKIVTLIFEGNRNFSDYTAYLLIIAIGFLLNIFCHTISTMLSHKNTFIVIGKIRQNMCDKLAKMPMGDILSCNSGEMKNLMVERVDAIEPTLAHMVPELTSKILAPLGVLIYMFCIDYRLALWSLVTLPIGFAFYASMFKDYEKMYGRYLVANKKLNSEAVEYINGIEVIKAFDNSTKAYKKFSLSAREASSSAIDWMRDSQFAFAAAMCIIPATLIAVLPFSIVYYLNGTLLFGDMITIILLSLALMAPLIAAFGYGESIAQVGLIVNDVATIIEADELVRPSEKVDIKNYDINFDDVEFGYKETQVLHKINFDIESGKVTALVGPSGSGKSTIAKLIASMWDINNGSITIGGIDIKKIPLAQLNDIIAYVAQDNYLFDESIMENIRKGNLNASDGEVIQMAKASGCHEFIMSLENGYQTIAGGAGGHLSGGERQRVSIARAMLKNSPIVILDEATAYTDPENEAIIQDAVSALVKNKTLIVVAHRLSTITDSDKIIVIEDGDVAGEGSHEQLMKENALYQSLYNAHIGASEKGGAVHD